MSFTPPTPKQARVMWFALTTLSLVVVAALIGLVLWGTSWVLHRLSGVLVPLAFALILSYILDPVVDYFESKKISRLWAITLVFALGLVAAAAVIGSVLPDLIQESHKLAEDLPASIETLRGKIDRFVQDSPLGQQLPESWRAALQPSGKPPAESEPKGTNWAAINPKLQATNGAAATEPAPAPNLGSEITSAESVVPGLTSALVFITKWFTNQLSKMTTWVEFLIGFILVPVYLFYFLLEKDGIMRRWPDYLPMKSSAAKDETVFIIRAVNECLIVFFRGQVLVALCVGVLLTIGYLILGLNYAVLLGLMAATLGIVPYLGTILTLVLALAVAGVQFGDWTHPLCVLGIAAAVKLIEDFVISPKIMGKRAGMHPLTIIVAVMVGMTLLGGFLGALLAIPLTAVLRTLMYRYIWIRENPGKVPKDETVFLRRCK